jgi:hypothetical protein
MQEAPSESIVVCEHCRGVGAEVGWLGDRHVDQIECIESLRDQIATLTQRVAVLEAYINQLPMFSERISEVEAQRFQIDIKMQQAA